MIRDAEPVKLTDFIRHAINDLQKVGIDNPSLDARLLIGHVLKLDRAELLSQTERILSIEEIIAVESLLKRRKHHESLARILGKREFWGLDFYLNEATLEPRADSETLVEAVVNIQKSLEKVKKIPAPRILDLGTGSGCLLLALLSEFPTAVGVGVDIAPRAIEQAETNATLLKLNSRVIFYLSNWLSNVKGKFDIITVNPPYIPSTELNNLMPDVRFYDPQLALNGGIDGLTAYRCLIPELANFLELSGLVAFEVGIGQFVQVADLLRHNGFVNITIHKDLGGIERCVTAFLATPRPVEK